MAHPVLFRKDPRQERSDDRVKVGRRHADADQRPHVGAAVHDRVPAAPEEWQGGPEDDRRGQQEFEIAGGLMPDPVAHRQRDQFTHRQDDERHRRRRRNPHPAREVGQLLAGFIRGDHRFQRHAADRAGSRRIPDDLGVHRTGVLGIGWSGLLLSSGPARSVEPRIGLELRLAFFRAEMKGLALKLCVTAVRLDRDRHAADRVLCRLGPRRDVGRLVMMIMLHGLSAFHCLFQLAPSRDWKLKPFFNDGRERLPGPDCVRGRSRQTGTPAPCRSRPGRR